MFNGTANKFIGALLTGGIAWATMVVNSAPKAITAPEWIAGAGFLVVAIQTYLLKNAPPAPPVP